MTTNHEPEARDLLETLPDVTDAQLRTLHDRLAASAAAEGVLDVAYRTLDTPVGTLLLAATDQGLVRVAWPNRGPRPGPGNPRHPAEPADPERSGAA